MPFPKISGKDWLECNILEKMKINLAGKRFRGLSPVQQGRCAAESSRRICRLNRFQAGECAFSGLGNIAAPRGGMQQDYGTGKNAAGYRIHYTTRPG